MKLIGSAQLLLLSVLLNRSSKTLAFPNGAGGCEGGDAAVGGAHTDDASKQTLTGPIHSNSYEVSINGQRLIPGRTFTIQPGVDNDITVTATDKRVFRGFLMRLEGPDWLDLSGSLVPKSEDAQIASACLLPVVGITHTDSEAKSKIVGTLRVEEEVGSITLDVTVVLRNNPNLSRYYYTGFDIAVQSQRRDAPVVGGSAALLKEWRSLQELPSDFPSDMPSEQPTVGGGSSVPTVVDLPDTPPPTPDEEYMPSAVPGTSAPVALLPTVPAPTAAPTDSLRVCEDGESDLRQCYESIGQEAANACDACVANRIPSSVGSCDELEQVICEAIDDCPCSDCDSELENYLDCAFDAAVGCPISC